MKTAHTATCLSLPSPRDIIRALPCDAYQHTIEEQRHTVRSILNGKDPRLLAIVGPCSIHCLDAAWEYASKLKAWLPAVSQQLLIVMRVYMEKPRSSVGWPGYLHDPHCDGSGDILHGIQQTRAFFIRLIKYGMPIATEFVHPLLAPYLSDLPAWVAIGARTVQSPTHRTLAAGLPMPVGFKNPPCGHIEDAVHAIKVASTPQHQLTIHPNGRLTYPITAGNPDTHLVLRGSRTAPNYDEKHLHTACAQLMQHHLPPRLLIDCSHGNSRKDPTAQARVLLTLLAQRKALPHCVKGFMLESFLQTGQQSLTTGGALEKGKSITDPCLGWEQTRLLLQAAAERIRRQSPCAS